MSKKTHVDFDKLDNEAKLDIDRLVFGYTVTDEEVNRIDPRNIKIDEEGGFEIIRV